MHPSWNSDMGPFDAMRQAGMTTAEYMRDAVESIDKQFGDGYAKANPVLVAAFIQAAAHDYHAMAVSVAGGKVSAAISEAVFYIINTMETDR